MRRGCARREGPARVQRPRLLRQHERSPATHVREGQEEVQDCGRIRAKEVWFLLLHIFAAAAAVIVTVIFSAIEIDVPSFVVFMCSPFDWYSIFAAAALPR